MNKKSNDRTNKYVRVGRQRRRSKALPGGGELTLVSAPDSEDYFSRGMELRRGSLDSPMDEAASLELLEMAAQEKHLGASAAIALLCEGKIAEEDRERHFNRSEKWIYQSAEQGNQWGLLFLGTMHFDGQRVEQDYGTAAKYFQRAADQGNASALGFLGYMYSAGHGVLQNRQTSVSYYRQAADKGHVVAQFDLGVCYAQGRGVPKDRQEAIKWFTRAAERGDVLSLIHI